ncbi:MAG: hypothetical protein JWN94_3520 [Betaproteobacteria bacterium]|nr:hypothetical protein [Betaproteobacteria bacterium]
MPDGFQTITAVERVIAEDWIQWHLWYSNKGSPRAPVLDADAH